MSIGHKVFVLYQVSKMRQRFQLLSRQMMLSTSQ
jgi:hypothetical protein